MKNVIILGASGNIAKHVIDILVTEITQREVSPLTARDVLQWVDEITFA
jgi:saccharopine dehydrogenase-like NADP-dependent oxidoreductase